MKKIILKENQYNSLKKELVESAKLFEALGYVNKGVSKLKNAKGVSNRYMLEGDEETAGIKNEAKKCLLELIEGLMDKQIINKKTLVEVMENFRNKR